MLNKYLEQFELAPHYTNDEVEHWFIPRPDVVDAFVIEDSKSKEIKGFTSYYTLPSTVMRHPTYKNIKAAYSFYNIPSETVSLQAIVGDALVIARNVSSTMLAINI